MKGRDELILDFVRRHGVTRARELTAESFHSQEVMRLVAAQMLERFGRGIYAVPQRSPCRRSDKGLNAATRLRGSEGYAPRESDEGLRAVSWLCGAGVGCAGVAAFVGLEDGSDSGRF